MTSTGATYTGIVNSINSGATTVRGGTNFGAGAITIAAYPGELVTIQVGGGAPATRSRSRPRRSNI